MTEFVPKKCNSEKIFKNGIVKFTRNNEKNEKKSESIQILPRNNPFGEAKPRDENKILKKIEEGRMKKINNVQFNIIYFN